MQQNQWNVTVGRVAYHGTTTTKKKTISRDWTLVALRCYVVSFWSELVIHDPRWWIWLISLINTWFWPWSFWPLWSTNKSYWWPKADMSCCFKAWQMVIATRFFFLDWCLLAVTVEQLQTGCSLFLILSHPSTFINFHPSIEILVPSRSAHEPVKCQSLSKHIYCLDTAYLNIYKHTNAHPKWTKAVSVGWQGLDREGFETYTANCSVFCVWPEVFVLCFICVCVCVVSTSPTGRTSIHHIRCIHSSQPQARVFSVLIEISYIYTLSIYI